MRKIGTTGAKDGYAAFEEKIMRQAAIVLSFFYVFYIHTALGSSCNNTPLVRIAPDANIRLKVDNIEIHGLNTIVNNEGNLSSDISDSYFDFRCSLDAQFATTHNQIYDYRIRVINEYPPMNDSDTLLYDISDVEIRPPFSDTKFDLCVRGQSVSEIRVLTSHIVYKAKSAPGRKLMCTTVESNSRNYRVVIVIYPHPVGGIEVMIGDRPRSNSQHLRVLSWQ